MKKIISVALTAVAICMLMIPVFATPANTEEITYAVCEYTNGEYDVLSTAKDEIFALDVCDSLNSTYQTEKFIVEPVRGHYKDVSIVDAEEQLNN